VGVAKPRARVVPQGATKPQYWCVAAFHHQFCYRILPPLATRCLLTLIKQKDNAKIIRFKIESIHEKYGTMGEKPDIPDIPCPYIALLLAICWTVNLDPDRGVYASGIDDDTSGLICTASTKVRGTQVNPSDRL
jgi:hypothetical protein